ncbi:uncharacterized protein (TIGR03085 family) [Friedmanniella endophytica]|uniref:Uncharacterized protein (TIGR03085 family) n=1 Tax=Microlunatus kandeliicorticis TaxID=1759536 RepID=A0A7W3ITX2_9ACTN|nr:TIGR03085 family metal-binding protein [Microlunatus kandeliicorticis]MBA8795202.1 uncharacterized protein (TIGR03085 family) [Microlunatus kandeliicorticis]
MSFAKSERTQLADLFDAVGPDAPTLCEGWDAADLAAHLWMREHDPVGAAGLVAKPLAGLTERRMVETRARWPWPELVDRIRRGPGPFSLFALPGVDEPANAIEFFVHHEDVRRAGDPPLPPRGLDRPTEDWLWKRLHLMGRAFFRRSPVGVTLERAAGDGTSGEPETIRAQGGSRIVTVVGRPSEITLFAFGRTGAADVTLVGEPDAVDALTSGPLGV